MFGLDYETYCDVDLKKHGLDRYVNDPSFRVLRAAAYSHTNQQEFDFVENYDKAFGHLKELFQSTYCLVAQNAGFERAVSRRIGLKFEDKMFLDSAVMSRACGASGRLEAAAPQLLHTDKMEAGSRLIKKFSVPTKANNYRPYTYDELKADADLYADWVVFGEYCMIDAQLSYNMFAKLDALVPSVEHRYETLTQQMNDIGWYVDLDLVHNMQHRYEKNLAALEQEFRQMHDPTGKLNFRSYKQLQEWCAARGVRAKSFDQLHLSKLIRQVETKLVTTASGSQRANYAAVLDMLRVKQERGGSSLSKLQTIIDMTGRDGRLRNQYMHVGAGQTYRTSGRGVQMQNLVRLPDPPDDVESLFIGSTQWDNQKLAENIRQVFMAENPDGELIVGDFKSVESRGLAYIAGEQWKLDAYALNRDIYKMLAMTYQSFKGTAYEDVTKEQRQAGKVGELACGYGAGPAAVASFAEKMGIDMTESEAGSIVRDWRGANPKIVELWDRLNQMLHEALAYGSSQRYALPNGGSVIIHPVQTPLSLIDQHPGAQSIALEVHDHVDSVIMRRIFHGCYYRGKDVCYYKPSELKGGDLWRSRMTTPPHAWYKLYGGKLAGILTQSFCREMFFNSMREVASWLDVVPNAQLVGQFHDELVVEWWPQNDGLGVSLPSTMNELEALMGRTIWPNFPLVADVKHGHRYIK